MDLLEKLEEDFAALQKVGAFEQALSGWKTSQEVLRSFPRVEALVGFLRDPRAEPRRAKDAALAALCAEASAGDQSAATLLMWLMLPGLLLLRRRLAAWNELDREDLDAELLAGVWESATVIGPATANVAARLLDRARRRALAAGRQAADWAARIEPLTGEPEALIEPEARMSGVGDVLVEAVRAGVISESEADLFRASRATARALRSRLRVTENGVRSRRRRAKRRVLAWLAGSSPIPPQSLLLRTPQGIPTDTPSSPDTERPSWPPL